MTSHASYIDTSLFLDLCSLIFYLDINYSYDYNRSYSAYYALFPCLYLYYSLFLLLEKSFDFDLYRYRIRYALVS